MSSNIDIGQVKTSDILSGVDPDYRLAQYLDLLLDENQRVNLVSRALISEDTHVGNKRVVSPPVSRETPPSGALPPSVDSAEPMSSLEDKYPAGLLGILSESLLPFYYIEKHGSEGGEPKETTFRSQQKVVTPVSRETCGAGTAPWLATRMACHYLDIGSGGGFPALPIIMTQAVQSAVLVERTQKKGKALERMIAKLNLPAKVISQNLGECSFSTKFDLISIRYVKLDRQIIKTVLSLLKPNGLFLYYSEPEDGLLPSSCTATRYCFRLDSSPVIKHFTVIHN